MITRYEPVTHHASKSGVCNSCGKRTTRAKTFQQTLNPWNKNADGTVKTRAEIRGELLTEASDWQHEPIYHDRCEKAARA